MSPNTTGRTKAVTMLLLVLAVTGMCLTAVHAGECRCSFAYGPAAGETCASIAKQQGVDLAALERLNPACANLKSGDILCVPPGKDPCRCGELYISKPGETCESIARDQKADLAALEALNYFCYRMVAGDVICMPP